MILVEQIALVSRVGGNHFLLVVAEPYSGPILSPYIFALSVLLRRVVHGEEKFDEVVVGDGSRTVPYQDGLGVVANVGVGRVPVRTVACIDARRDETLNVREAGAKVGLDGPETTCGEHGEGGVGRLYGFGDCEGSLNLAHQRHINPVANSVESI